MNPWVLAAVATAALILGWGARSVVADRDMLEYRDELRAAQDDKKLLAAKVEAANTVTAEATTAAVDTQETKRVVEVRYVEREVTKYRDRPDTGKCKLPAEFMRLYNRAARAAS